MTAPPGTPPAPLPPVFPFAWAAAHGEDAHGLWQAVEVGSVRQTLRWIPPGRFTMGSPLDEHGRSDDEAEHEVTLAHGLWLADTACTQALWQAVLGANPSEFQFSPEHPVESVSWDDVTQRFLPALALLLPELDARLPTEEEWECACRAGTHGAYWFGEQVTREQVNFGTGRAGNTADNGMASVGPVAVKARPANAWGLYQMHGNVWEWCEDMLNDYPSGPITYPVNSGRSAKRIQRGGSWFTVAPRCRSAKRRGSPPGDRNRRFGFRLAVAAF